MRKNRMMRVASALLVVVLLTTCAISGTFAKYVTEGSANDSARVAKWGVQISTEGDGYFTTTFAADDEDTEIENTVIADVDVVAPGTNDEGAALFSLTGTPEVAVQVDIVVTGAGNAANATDVVLAEGEYWDWTKAPYSTKFEAEEYHPIVFTLKTGDTVLVEGTLAEVEEYLEDVSGEYAPGTDLSKIFDKNADDEEVVSTGVYTLTWNWEFEQDADKEDTVLGNIAAGIDTATEGTSTSLYFGIAITVTQID